MHEIIMHYIFCYCYMHNLTFFGTKNQFRLVPNLHMSIMTHSYFWHVSGGSPVSWWGVCLCLSVICCAPRSDSCTLTITPAVPILALAPLNYQIWWETPILYLVSLHQTTIVHLVFGPNNRSIKTRGGENFRDVLWCAMLMYDWKFIHVSFDRSMPLCWCYV